MPNTIRFSPAARLVMAATLFVAAVQAHTRAQFPAAPPSRPAAPAPTGTGVIVGQTVDGTTGRPVAGALVALTAAPPGLGGMTQGDTVPMDQLMSLDFGQLLAGTRQVMTDGQGRFAFTGLPKGSFELTARKGGWTGGAYGQRRPDGTRSEFTLKDDERVGNATLSLWKNAAIVGTVTDEAGEPIVRLTVRAQRRTWQAGRPRYSFGGIGQTDDRGVYRISGLGPGEYIAVIVQTPVTTPAAGAAPPMDAAAIQAMIAGAGGGSDPNAMLANIAALTASSSGGGIRVGDWALQTSQVVPPGTAADGRMLAYRTTFFPTATAASQASAMTLGSGEERSGVDFQLKPLPVVRISGTVTGPDGPLGGTSVRLLPAGNDDLSTDSGFESATTVTNPGGLFTFLAVPAGQYTLRVTRVPPAPPRPPVATPNMAMIQNGSGGTTMSMGPMSITMDMIMPMPSAIPTEPTLWAAVPVSVGDADVTGLAVSLRSGFRVSGRAEFEGAATKLTPDQLRRIPVAMDRADTGGPGVSPLGIGGSGGQFDANGQFTTWGLLPGKYFIRVPISLSGWTLKSAMLGGRDLADVPLEIDNGDVSGVVLTFTDHPTELSGLARTAQGQPDTEASVIVFPITPESWVDYGSSPRRLRSAKAGKDGRYRIGGLSAGEYFVAAVHGDVASDWQNPEFLRSLSRTAIKVTVGAGEKKSQDLVTR